MVATDTGFSCIRSESVGGKEEEGGTKSSEGRRITEGTEGKAHNRVRGVTKSLERLEDLKIVDKYLADGADSVADVKLTGGKKKFDSEAAQHNQDCKLNIL